MQPDRATAERFGFPAASLRNWEQGRRKPHTVITAYLAVIEREPEAVCGRWRSRGRREDC